MADMTHAEAEAIVRQAIAGVTGSEESQRMLADAQNVVFGELARLAVMVDDVISTLATFIDADSILMEDLGEVVKAYPDNELTEVLKSAAQSLQLKAMTAMLMQAALKAQKERINEASAAGVSASLQVAGMPFSKEELNEAIDVVGLERLDEIGVEFFKNAPAANKGGKDDLTVGMYL